VKASGLEGGTTRIRGDLSSQFLSGLLMTAPCARKPVEILVDGLLQSKPYIDLTLSVMGNFGVASQRQGYGCFFIQPQPYISPGTYRIEADVSSAAYFFAAPAICGGWVEVSHVSRKTRQGDIAFLDVLAAMGCQVLETEQATRVTGGKRLVGVEVNMGDFSDTAMTLAAIAPFAESPTTIRGIASSRLKETDRVAAICRELSRLGVRVEERADGMTIFPCERIVPGRIHTYNDHRIAMAFSLIGLRAPGIEIENPACVAKTFPGFFDMLDELK
jgi:3-phosphoshikimate 1-carboxyvinyltransferase